MDVPWSAGEKLDYQVTALGVTAAVLSFEVIERTEIFNLPAWHFKSSAKTHGFLSRLHNYEVKAESYLQSDAFKSLEWKTDSVEGKHTKLCLERHLPLQKKYFIYRQTDGVLGAQETRDFIHPENYSDIFSFFYILRIMSTQDIVCILRNYESKPVRIISLATENLIFNRNPIPCQKLIINFDGKEHTVWRELNNPQRILKAQVATSFASGTILLKT